MSRAEAWLFHLANALVGATGAALTWITLCWDQDPDSFGGHPWQPLWQHGHVLAAPAFVFALGILWTRHVLPMLRANGRRRRSSGWTMLLSALPMIASGYLLQVATDPGTRQAWSWVHLACSGLWTLGAILHFWPRLPASRNRSTLSAARS